MTKTVEQLQQENDRLHAELLKNATPEQRNAMSKPPRIERTKYRPNCAANPSDQWYGEIRKDGWLIDRKRMNQEQDIDQWLQAHDGETFNPSLAPAYAQMIKKYS